MSMEAQHLLGETPFPWQQQQWRRLLRQQAEGKRAHAYLFSGPAATGKFLFAYRFATYLLCLAPQEDMPCGHCRNCQAGGNAYHPDILVVAPQEGSRDIRIEQVRAIAEFATRTSHAGTVKAVILNHAHRLNVAAANALLKTLEEPRGDTCLLLVSELPGFLSATIRSRCQRLQFPAPGLTLAESWLRRQLTGDCDFTALLAVADCRPLAALALAESDVIADRQAFMQELAQVVAAGGSPLKLVRQGLTLGELATIEYLMASSTILVKALLTRDAAAIDSNGLGPLWATLQKQPAAVPLARKLMRFYQDALAARRQLLSGANPNGQLILESLLWRWSRLLEA